MAISVIQTAKGSIECNLIGRGKPLLFIHGGHVDCRETIFHKTLNPGVFLFVTPSRPGYGNTPLTALNQSPRGTADLLIALLNELEIDRVTVIGISAGGLIALEFAANYPDRMESLVLMSALTRTWFAKTDRIYRGAKICFAPKIERFTWSLYREAFKFFPETMARIMFRALSTYRPVTFTPNEFVELKQMTLNMRSSFGFSNDLDQTIEQEILSRVACPTLILHSEYDNAVSVSHAQNAKTNIGNSRLVTFKNRWGHLLWLGAGYDPVFKELIRHIENRRISSPN